LLLVLALLLSVLQALAHPEQQMEAEPHKLLEPEYQALCTDQPLY
jgi:hypothetical protein